MLAQCSPAAVRPSLHIWHLPICTTANSSCTAYEDMKITAPTSPLGRDAHTSCNGILLQEVVAGAVVLAHALVVASPLAGVGHALRHLSSGNIVKTKHQERFISRRYILNQLLFKKALKEFEKTTNTYTREKFLPIQYILHLYLGIFCHSF